MENKSAFCNQSKNAKSCAEKQEDGKKKCERTNEAAQLTECGQVGRGWRWGAGEVENKMKMGKKVTDSSIS